MGVPSESCGQSRRMSFSIGALPAVFALAAWRRIAREIDVSAPLKAAMQAEALRLHSCSATKREFVRGMGALLYNQPWRWERGQALLLERDGEDPSAEELLEAIYQWFTSATHKLHRRGQIRALLSQGMGHVICVSVLDIDGRPAPCGACDQQILKADVGVLCRMPPCGHPFCACSWGLKYP